MSDEAKIQQLVRRAWDEVRPIDMGHLSERDRVMVCETIVDLIEAISPRLKTRTGRRPYVVIVRDHHQLRIELREP
jgi:hypothetical protein